MKSDIIYDSTDVKKVYIKCVINNCKERANWGINWTPKHCIGHKLYIDENFIEKRCLLCGYTSIVNNENKCQKCKVSEPIALHPYFTIIPVGQRRKTLGSPDGFSTTLRLTRSSPDILSKNVVLDKTKPIRSETQAELQSVITMTKQKLREANAILERYSPSDMSSSKIAARDECTRLEKEVEDASKAWRRAYGPKY